MIVFRRASTDAAGSLGNLREIDIELFNRTGKHIKVFRVDNGPEYDNQLIRTYCKENGIKIQFSLPYRHNNATAERFWRMLMEGAMTQVHQSNLPRDFLFDAAMHFNYTRNNMPGSIQPGINEYHHSSGERTPFKLYYGRNNPIIKFLPFGWFVQ
jgi:transposase InsO family protein